MTGEPIQYDLFGNPPPEPEEEVMGDDTDDLLGRLKAALAEVTELTHLNAGLEKQLDAQARHDALGPGEACPVCSHMEWDEMERVLTAEQAENDRLRAEVAELRANPRDEFHTMAELYDYRMLYNAVAANQFPATLVCKSWRHSDGEECFGGGWFIVVMNLPTGQVSNHYKAEHWGLFRVPEWPKAPVWDGHTPAQAAERLKAFLAVWGRL